MIFTKRMLAVIWLLVHSDSMGTHLQNQTKRGVEMKHLDKYAP